MEGCFDSLGNVTSVTDHNNNTVTYTYDYLGQLVGETNANGSYTVTYDDRGNILTKGNNTYTYGNASWQDQLTNYNGTAITYDAIGNPNNWRDNMELHWTNGRQLYHANQTGGNDAWYHYDSAGIRTSKTVNADYVDFTYVDGKLVYQENHESSWWFYYDHSGKLVAMDYNGTLYYYMYDSIGNIFGLVDANGVFVANYTYDAWGKILSATGSMAEINPIRYKGYYYDTETGYYYLMSRYYDPVVGRFLNADSFAGTGQGVTGFNMFAYCGNNPVSRTDFVGKSWIGVLIVSLAVVGVRLIINNKIDSQKLHPAESELAKQEPLLAFQVNEAKKIADKYAEDFYGIDDIREHDDNQVNAFRHAMWNAVMTDKIGATYAEKFATAHEQVPDLEIWAENCAMDMHNNALGRRIATEYAGEGYDMFAWKIVEAIANDEAVVLRWDDLV